MRFLELWEMPPFEGNLKFYLFKFQNVGISMCVVLRVEPRALYTVGILVSFLITLAQARDVREREITAEKMLP